MCHSVHGTLRLKWGTTCEVSSLFHTLWILEIKLLSLGLHGKSIYVLSHLVGPTFICRQSLSGLGLTE